MIKNKYIAPEIEITSFAINKGIMTDWNENPGDIGNEGGQEKDPSDPEIDPGFDL